MKQTTLVTPLSKPNDSPKVNKTIMIADESVQETPPAKPEELMSRPSPTLLVEIKRISSTQLPIPNHKA
jgi:hypothetical protein